MLLIFMIILVCSVTFEPVKMEVLCRIVLIHKWFVKPFELMMKVYTSHLDSLFSNLLHWYTEAKV